MISSDAELVEQYKNVTDNLGYVVAVLIVSAGLLAFVVQYNLSNINITERTMGDCHLEGSWLLRW